MAKAAVFRVAVVAATAAVATAETKTYTSGILSCNTAACALPFDFDFSDVPGQITNALLTVEQAGDVDHPDHPHSEWVTLKVNDNVLEECKTPDEGDDGLLVLTSAADCTDVDVTQHITDARGLGVIAAGTANVGVEYGVTGVDGDVVLAVRLTATITYEASTAATTTAAPASKKNTLSTGALVAIIVGVVLIVVFLVYFYFFWDIIGTASWFSGPATDPMLQL